MFDNDEFKNSFGDDFGSAPHNDRDRLEINSDGVSKGELKDSKRIEKEAEWEQNNKRGLFGRRRNPQGGRFSGRGRERSLLGVIISLVLIVGTVIYIPIAYKEGSLIKPLRSLFATPEQNKNAFYNSVFKVKDDVSKTAMTDSEKEANAIDPFYEKNLIYEEDYIREQVDPEYMVFLSTGVEKTDKPFIKWIKDYESAKGSKFNNFKVYRYKLENLGEDGELANYYDSKPMIAIYNTPFQNRRELDSVVKDPKMLGEIPAYMEKMMAESNNNRDNHKKDK